MLFSRVCGMHRIWKVALASTLLLCLPAAVQAQSQARSKSAPRTGQLPATLISAKPKTKPRGYLPAHQRSGETSVRVLKEQPKQAASVPRPDPEPEEVTGEQPDMLFEDEGQMVEPTMEGSMMGSMVGDLGDCDSCGTCDGPCVHQPGCLIPCPTSCWDKIELFGGAHGFTGPLNRGSTGSFGFDEGVNWGAPVPCLCTGELGMQAGVRAAHSNFEGASFTTDERSQIFVTAGVFRRVDWGFQGGVVMDYLHEDWYFEADLAQLRGELSWVYPCNHEIGFWFTTNTQRDLVTTRTTNGTAVVTASDELQATDLYAFFYRHRLDNAGAANGRLFAGFTGESDGFLGADVNVPISDCWAIQSGFAYLVPEENSHVEESWNFGLGLVWRPGGGLMCGRNYYRPLFDVAHNGNFMVDRD